MKTKINANLYILLAALYWSSGGILVKMISFDPFNIAFFRALIGLIAFGIYLKKSIPKLNMTIILSALCIALTNVLFVIANKLTFAANAIILQYTAPIFVIFMDFFINKIKATRHQLLTILLCIVGVVLFFFNDIGTGKIIGNLIALFSGITFAGVFFINRFKNSSTVDSAFLSNFMIVIVLLPFAIINPIKSITINESIAVFLLGTIQVFMAYIFFSKGIKGTSSINASLISIIEAVLNPLWVAIFFNELPNTLSFIGFFIIIFASIYNTFKENTIETDVKNSK